MFALVAAAILILSNAGLDVPVAHAPRYVHSYVLPLGAYPLSIVTGPDNALWFSTFPFFTNHQPIDLGVGRITTRGAYSFILIGKGTYDVAAGADNRIWFTNPYKRPYDVGAITMAGQVRRYAVPSDGSRSRSPPDQIDISGSRISADNRTSCRWTSAGVDATFHLVRWRTRSRREGGRMWFDGVGNPGLAGRVEPRGFIGGTPSEGRRIFPAPSWRPDDASGCATEALSPRCQAISTSSAIRCPTSTAATSITADPTETFG